MTAEDKLKQKIKTLADSLRQRAIDCRNKAANIIPMCAEDNSVIKLLNGKAEGIDEVLDELENLIEIIDELENLIYE